MARNVVQFQKGVSEPAFDRQYGTEEQCWAVVIDDAYLGERSGGKLAETRSVCS